MKKILLSLFDSNIVRNILRTDVVRVLLESNDVNSIVILTHPTKVNEYKKEFTSPKIIFDSYPLNKPSRSELFSWFLIKHTIHTKNVRSKIDEIYDRDGSYFLRKLLKYVIALITFYVSYIKIVDLFIKKITIFCFNEKKFEPLIEKYNPDLVFLPTIFGNNDIRLLKLCLKKNIPNMGMIKSWDNLLGKDPLLLWPNYLVVHNEIVKKLAISMHGYPKERIFISGIPQFDVYQNKDFVLSREDFFNRLKINPDKKLIVYSAMGGWISLYEVEIIKMLADIINNSDSLLYSSQLLVRLHPAYLSEDEKLKEIPNIILVRPGVSSFNKEPGHIDFEFRNDDTLELASTLKWANVLINSGSTMTIDAVCFDTPVINIGFDGYVSEKILEKSAKRLLMKDHYLPIIKSGGVKAVYNKEELVEAINTYLKDPSIDQEGRKRIVNEQCYKFDGKSGQRIGYFILNHLNK
jgi:hypothetical protein